MKSVKDILRKLIIGFLLVYVIYVIYILYLSTIKNIEGYSNTLDCSNCEMKPGNSGNCMSIMDVSYNYMNNNMDISFLDTSYVFCEWEPNCPNLNNIISQSERLDISKADMVNNKGINNIICCSQSEFYNKNTIDYNNISKVKDIKNKCNKINQFAKLDKMLSSNDYYKLRNICNTPSKIGMLFDTDNKTKYKLLNENTTLVSNEYILEKNEFFNCFGDKKKLELKDFSEQDKKKLEEDSFFDVADDAEYTTMQDNKQRLYPSRQDFEMEMKNLPPVNQSGTAPVGVINQYLNAINSFYDKQMNQMLGPRTHAFPQTLQFDNGKLSSNSNTFFVYDNSYNNEYKCNPGITGNKNFQYCGPDPYYKEF